MERVDMSSGGRGTSRGWFWQSSTGRIVEESCWLETGYIRVWLLNEQRISFHEKMRSASVSSSSRGGSSVGTFKFSCPKHHHPHFSNISLRTASTSISQLLQRSRHISNPQGARSDPWWYNRMLLLSPWTHKRKHESCSGYHPKRVLLVFASWCRQLQPGSWFRLFSAAKRPGIDQCVERIDSQ